VIRTAALVAACAALAAAEPVFLPPAAALGEPLVIIGPSGVTGSITAGPGRHSVAGVDLHLVAPGSGAEVRWDGHRLVVAGGPAVLVAPWRDPVPDRRWAWLPGGEAPRCAILLADPPPAADGAPVLPAQIVVAQGIDPRPGVAIALSGAERFAAWRVRDWRLALGWLVEDLHRRGARRVVLLGPAAPQPEQAALAALAREAATVAAAHGAGWIPGDALADPALWDGPVLSAAGRAARDRLLAAVMEPAWTVSSSAPTQPSSSPR
jgi:hypothetical protein